MLLEKVKIALGGNRVKILCSNCGESNPECETYADLEDKPFTYYCESCVNNLSELKNERTN
jgi:late competence protein required for DNA uptake (superfamily II DNA/RNA helicase)